MDPYKAIKLSALDRALVEAHMDGGTEIPLRLWRFGRTARGTKKGQIPEKVWNLLASVALLDILGELKGPEHLGFLLGRRGTRIEKLYRALLKGDL